MEKIPIPQQNRTEVKGDEQEIKELKTIEEIYGTDREKDKIFEKEVIARKIMEENPGIDFEQACDIASEIIEQNE